MNPAIREALMVADEACVKCGGDVECREGSDFTECCVPLHAAIRNLADVADVEGYRRGVEHSLANAQRFPVTAVDAIRALLPTEPQP